jgi:hypothetical protein
MARATPTHSKPLGKRDGIRAAPRVFSAVELLNLWEPTGAWEEYRGLAYGEGPREKLDVYRPRRWMFLFATLRRDARPNAPAVTRERFSSCAKNPAQAPDVLPGRG